MCDHNGCVIGLSETGLANNYPTQTRWGETLDKITLKAISQRGIIWQIWPTDTMTFLCGQTVITFGGTVESHYSLVPLKHTVFVPTASSLVLDCTSVSPALPVTQMFMFVCTKILIHHLVGIFAGIFFLEEWNFYEEECMYFENCWWFILLETDEKIMIVSKTPNIMPIQPRTQSIEEYQSISIWAVDPT